MTERKLFKTTLIILTLSLVLPLLFLFAGNNSSRQMADRVGVFVLKQNVDSKVNPGPSDVSIDSSVLDGYGSKNEPTKAPNTVQSTQGSAQQPAQTAPNLQQKGAESKPVQQQTGVKSQTSTAKSASQYTVKAGDTYGCIAEKYYGSYDQWSRVYAANAGSAGYSEYNLDVGAKLVLPAVNASEVTPSTSLCS